MKKGQKIYEMFEQMTEGFDMLVSGLEHPAATLKYGYEYLKKIKDRKKRYEKSQLIKTLEQQEYFISVKRGRNIFYKMTKKGWKQKLKNRIINKRKKLGGGKVCIVSFDIPETSRGVRHALRNLLAEAEFRQVHKSVWVGDRDVVRELKTLVKALGAGGWVHIFVGKKAI